MLAKDFTGRVGDIVRVTYTGSVTAVDAPDEALLLQVSLQVEDRISGNTVWVPPGAEIEILDTPLKIGSFVTQAGMISLAAKRIPLEVLGYSDGTMWARNPSGDFLTLSKGQYRVEKVARDIGV